MFLWVLIPAIIGFFVGGFLGGIVLGVFGFIGFWVARISTISRQTDINTALEEEKKRHFNNKD
jgi:hypothetical protein